MYKIKITNKTLNIFFIFSFQILLNSVQSSDSYTLQENTSLISFNGEVIYITDSSNEIKKLDSSVFQNHNLSITKNKEILNINNTAFIIFGLNDDDKLLYQKFVNQDSFISSQQTIISNIDFKNYNKYHIHCNINNNYCIVALAIINNNNILIYQINLKNDSITQKSPFSEISSSSLINIQCESFQINQIFCIIGINESNQNRLYYYFYNYDSNRILNSKISDNYISASLGKLNSENKFLVCYLQSQSTICKCQYFDLISGSISSGEKHEITFTNRVTINDKNIIILNIYNNSIFFEITYIYYGVALSFTTLLSPDFKIKIESNIVANGKAIKVFNDENNYYNFYYYQVRNEYNLIKNDLIQYTPQEPTFYFSKYNPTEYYDFSSSHNYQFLFYSLDKETRLYKNNALITSNLQLNNNMTLTSNDNFYFHQTTNNIKLVNYFCYATLGTSDNNDIIFNSISLIGKIQTKNCYDSCQSCNLDEIGTITNHYCTQCNADYYSFYEESLNDYYNCYLKNSTEVSKAYFSDNFFYDCKESCASCEEGNTCLTCIENYFFKANEKNELETIECINYKPDDYYLDNNANIPNKKNETIKAVYKHCYETCSKCNRNGTSEQNNCLECNQGLFNYKFQEGQCLIDTATCIEEKKFWKLDENNNISCLEACNGSLITEGENKGQCVSDCQKYVNPYLSVGERDTYYLTLNCSNQSYCIPYESCNDIKFTPSRTGIFCQGSCQAYDIYNFSNIKEYIDSIPVPEEPKQNMTKEEKLISINKRKKRIEFLNEEKNYEEVINSFGVELISNYNELFKKQSGINDDIGFLITSTTYDNFTITIYPLDVENFAYDNVFIVKNLGFVNFTKMYPDFIDYEVDSGNLILVCIMEYFSHDYSINDLNYFIYAFNELSNSSFRILEEQEELPTINDLEKNSENFEILYPLHNFKDENLPCNKRNSEYLVDNMKQMYKNYPQINTFDINDDFYTDICFLFTSDVGTDMSLKDRLEEYYVNYYLCEDNCTLKNVINRDSIPRSICSCEDKTNLIFNRISGKENFESHSTIPVKSIKCIKQSFNVYVGKNPIFWIFMIILVYQIYFLVMYLKYQSKTIQQILNIKDNPSTHSNNSGSISSNAFSKINVDDNNEIKNKEENDNSMSEKVKSSSKSEKYSSEDKGYNPPKKEKNFKHNISKEKMNTMDKDKDLISKSESTVLKDNKDKYMNGSDISYSEIKYECDTIEVNNLIERNKLMENNFLNDPITLENKKKMKIIKRHAHPLKENETKKYLETFEDVLYSNNNKHKFKNKKNKNIANNLDGGDIINKNLIDNLSENENNPRFPKNKLDVNATSDKDRTIGEDKIIFQGNDEENNNKDNENDNNKNGFIKEDEDALKAKKDKNKKFIDKLFQNKKNTLAKSLSKNEINNAKNEKEKRRNSDEDLNNNNRVKKDLIKIGKARKIRPNSSIKKSHKQKQKKMIYDNKNDYYEKKNEHYDNDNNFINNIKKSNKNDNDINISKNNSNNNNLNNKKIIKYTNLKQKNKYKHIEPKINKKIIEDSDNSNGNLKNKSLENNSNSYSNNNSNLDKIRALKLKNKKDNIFNISNSNSNSNNSNKEENTSNSKENSKNVDTKRMMIKFHEETEMEGDRLGQKAAMENLKRKRTQNLELLNDKAVISSVVEFLETENKEIMVEENFILFYWKYFLKREIWFITIRDKKNTLPYYIRYSSLGFCITFIFLLNCFFFFESDIHKRYINALDGTNINISYYFKKELGTTICVALLGNVFKMILIKLLLYRVFKIGKTAKKLMKSSSEKGLNANEVERLNLKREKFFKYYKIFTIIYFSALMALSILFGYICTCYGGVYKNSINYFLFGLLFSIIFSFIFCAAICFLIVSLYKIGKICDSKCVVSGYIVLSTLY